MVACGAHYITLQSPVIRILSDGKRGCRFIFSARFQQFHRIVVRHAILLPYNTVSMSGASSVALCIYGNRDKYGIAPVGGPSATELAPDMKLSEQPTTT